MPRKELGEILLEADLINPVQLKEALALQRTYGERLASVLVRQNILTEKFAVTYLGRQLGMPPVDISKTDIEVSLLDVVPLELCERHLVFPIKVEGTRLQIAMSDPMDHGLVSEIEFKTGVRLAPMIALEASIKNAILEARRAIKSGHKKISPNVQKSRPVQPVAAAAPQPHAATRIPLVPLEDRERAVIETLAGAPVHTPPPPSARERAPSVEEVQTILAVDDEPEILRLVQQLLEAKRYRVVTARGGRMAAISVRRLVALATSR